MKNKKITSGYWGFIKRHRRTISTKEVSLRVAKDEFIIHNGAGLDALVVCEEEFFCELEEAFTNYSLLSKSCYEQLYKAVHSSDELLRHLAAEFMIWRYYDRRGCVAYLTIATKRNLRNRLIDHYKFCDTSQDIQTVALELSKKYEEIAQFSRYKGIYVCRCTA